LYDWFESTKKVSVTTKEEEEEYDSKSPVDWANIFFKLAHYCNLKKQDVWELTLPQLGYYLEQCSEHIEFTIKVSSLSMGGLGLSDGVNNSLNNNQEEQREDGTYMNGYKVADAEDMNFLAQLL